MLIVLTSAQGSPGVSTTALGLALSWDRPVLLIDADPTGSGALEAGYLQGYDLGDHPGLVDLAVSYNNGTLAQDLPAAALPIPKTHVRALLGARSHVQAPTLQGLWEPLGAVLANLDATGQDVIVDAGRLGLVGSPTPLLSAADLTVLITRSTLPALIGAKGWADTLSQDFTEMGTPERLGLLVVGQGHPYTEALAGETVELPPVASIAWDPVTAEVFSRGTKPGRGFNDSPLVKSLQTAMFAIKTRVERNSR